MKRHGTAWSLVGLILGLAFLLLRGPIPLAQEARDVENCRACHEDVRPESLEGSVHAALSCGACHPGAIVNPHEEPVTAFKACTSCHPPSEPCWESVHGRDFLHGVEAVPSCADCHGAHQMESVDTPSSPVYPANLPKTCGGCHENAALAERFGLPSGRYTTYIDSFHGILLQEGQLVAANCTSCHGSHLVLAASNPRSSIHPANPPRNLWRVPSQRGRELYEGQGPRPSAPRRLSGRVGRAAVLHRLHRGARGLLPGSHRPRRAQMAEEETI